MSEAELLMTKGTRLAASCHIAGGVAMGYIVFVDDGQVFDWPIWVLVVVAICTITFLCNRVLVHGGSALKARALATSFGAAAMLGAALVYDWRGVLAKEPLASILTVVFLLLFCNVYFLPAWIGAVLPPRRVGGIRI